MSEKSVVSRLIKAIETAEGSPLSLDDVGLLMLSVGRTNGPFIVSQLFESGLLREEDLPALVTAAWSMAEFPMRMIPRLEWIRMWDSAGYSVDGRPAQRPIGSRTLYRGAPRSRRFGFAWTSDLQQAIRFADRNVYFDLPDSGVWVAEVGPSRLWAEITQGRNEHEFVVDTRGLAITAYVES